MALTFVKSARELEQYFITSRVCFLLFTSETTKCIIVGLLMKMLIKVSTEELLSGRGCGRMCGFSVWERDVHETGEDTLCSVYCHPFHPPHISRRINILCWLCIAGREGGQKARLLVSFIGR